MPIGVPRIIYSWGEELPAQWTDIYNFIFRRRMVFLMQYLDDELCNQICGLLINIHMEDRSKELEKKEMEKSGLFKSGTRTSKMAENLDGNTSRASLRSQKTIEDLMLAEDDLRIDQNDMLERYTLQKMTLEWLNWNAQFFDYSDEPYLFYLSEILSKDFTNFQTNSFAQSSAANATLFKMLKNAQPSSGNNDSLNVYAPFRFLENFATPAYEDFHLSEKDQNRFRESLNQLSLQAANLGGKTPKLRALDYISQQKAQSTFHENFDNQAFQKSLAENAFSQRRLRQTYNQENHSKSSSTYLNSLDDQSFELKNQYRKQTERSLQDEESKKVFVIINSFGGSVGNGITVHDALQFIKAGSLTLALGVAASAASLALAGGTIGERYVTEGCHVMIHQPEGGLSGQASDIWIDSQEIMKIRLDVAEIYSLATYRPRHKILRDLDRDFYLTATETVFYGLADEIATNEVMHEIIEMTNKVWDYHESQQQRLLESRDRASSGLETQAQS